MSITVNLTANEIEMAERVGRARQELHEGTGNDWNHGNRFYDDSATTNIIGVYGEVGFAKIFGQPVDVTLCENGDNGIDFAIKMDFGVVSTCNIDVKTAVYPKYLLVRENEIKYPTNIYVLCKYTRFDNGLEYLGWIDHAVIKQQPVKDYGGYGIRSYGMLAEELNDMSLFVDAFNRALERPEKRHKNRRLDIF